MSGPVNPVWLTSSNPGYWLSAAQLQRKLDVARQYDALSDADKAVLSVLCSGGTSPGENRRNARAIQLYGDVARVFVLDLRAQIRKRDLLWQRKWQTTATRRAQRNHHHDSWDARERYVRYGGGYGTAATARAIGHQLIADAISNGARRFGTWVMQYVRQHPIIFDNYDGAVWLLLDPNTKFINDQKVSA